MRLTLGLASSTPKIEDVSHEWQQEFGMEAAVCRGRTLNLVLGPDSNAKILSSLLETVQHGKYAEAHVMLYASTGAGALYHLRGQPSSSGEQCELDMSRCDTLSFDEAIREDERVKVMLEAKKPYRVSHVSDAFCAAYGMTAANLSRRTLAMIHGPNTDVPSFTKMLDGAMTGSMQSARIHTYRSDGSEIETRMARMCATPVEKGGVISHILVQMGSRCGSSSVSPMSWDAVLPKEQDLPLGDSGKFASVGPLNDDSASKRQPCEQAAARHVPASDKTSDVAATRKSTTHQSDCDQTLRTVRLAALRLQLYKAEKRIRYSQVPNLAPTSPTAVQRPSKPSSLSQPSLKTKTVDTHPLLGLFWHIMSAVLTVLATLSFGLISPLKRQCSPCASNAGSRRSSSYGHDWQLLHFDEVSDGVLGGFSPYY